MNKSLFVVILALAIFLRIFRLDSIPPSLNWDEVSIGYNAFSILQTGKDEWGENFPLSFRAFGDYKLPGYIYFDTIFIALFGLNEWGVRLPSAFLGIGFIILIFLTFRKLTNTNTGLWGMFLASILPWSLIVSRIGLEAHLSLFLTTLGFYMFLLGLEKKFWLTVSALIFGLTIFSYNSSRVVTPLLILVLIFFYKKEFFQQRKVALISLIIFLVFFSVTLPKAIQQDSSARYRWITILDEGAILRINELRGNSNLPSGIKSILYNKVTYFIPEVVKNYVSHFSPKFLFLQGGSNYQFSIPGSGLLYLVLAPALILGLLQILRLRQKWQLVILSWLLISIIPAAITRDSPHPLRSIMAMTPLLIISSLGINQILKFKNSRYLVVGIIVILMASLYLFWQNYSNDYTKNYSWSWQYGYSNVVDFVKNEGSKFDKIFITKKYGEPHEFFLFYLKIDPQKYQTDQSLVRYQKSDWFWADRFDKFIFINDWEVKEKAICNTKCLLITSPGNYPQGSKLLDKVSFLDGKEAFDIVEPPKVQ